MIAWLEDKFVVAWYAVLTFYYCLRYDLGNIDDWDDDGTK